MFEFSLLTRATTVPSGPDWIHEIKYDGYRLRLEPNHPAYRRVQGPVLQTGTQDVDQHPLEQKRSGASQVEYLSLRQGSGHTERAALDFFLKECRPLILARLLISETPVSARRSPKAHNCGIN